MEKRLLMEVHLLDDRYHGESEWPPSPARLFQALLAGNAVGAQLPDDCADALRWLETLPEPPQIRAQRGRLGLKYSNFVPNNDLDAKGGDPKQIANIRVAKSIQSRHLDAGLPIVYIWRFEADDIALHAADHIRAMAENLYQLGRGVDMAWASAKVLDAQDGDRHFEAALGDTFLPGDGTGGVTLACPERGSLDSLLLRFQANRIRFKSVTDGKKTKIYFTNPPKARFRPATYNPAVQWRLFDLRAANEGGAAFRAWPQDRAAVLVGHIRDRVVERLTHALPDQAELIERVMVGHHATEADKDLRVRLIPLPSIGHKHTSPSIRRLLVMVPAGCPLPFGDIEWALSGLALDGGIGETLLIIADDLTMLHHYGLESGKPSRVWRSVTPIVLPQNAARRRIDPQHRHAEAKPGNERADEEQRASAGVIQALRHAGMDTRIESIRLRREPFSAKGARVEAFAIDTRFAKERLWHVELRLAEPVEGPVVIGDGRYLGLGLMAPVDVTPDVLSFRILDGLSASTDPEQLARALRSAVMSRVQHCIGTRQYLNAFFTGHASDGSPLRDGSHRHLVFASDLPRQRLLIIAPCLLEKREPVREELTNMRLLDTALTGLSVLRAGKSGKLSLLAIPNSLDGDPLFGPSTRWESVTAYRTTRYAKRASAAEALTADILRETLRRGLPTPKIRILSLLEGPRGSLQGRVSLTFPTPLQGPLILGKSCHFGGGLFGSTNAIVD